jgi:hypothetical protein
MRITIHQPEHIPWLGFFSKIIQADACVILDNVQFSKNYFQNRNKIRTHNGWNWVTVPVTRNLNTLIRDVVIADDKRWKKKWWQSIELAYKKSLYAELYLDSIYLEISKDWEKLSDLNCSFIKLLLNHLGIKTRLFMASDINTYGKGSDLILDICKYFEADTYLSGISGTNYLNLNDFHRSGINVEFQEFHHPIYTQMHQPFIPCMSVIDLLFNHGPSSRDIIQGIGVAVIEDVFL